jgi:hypothetical protein
MPEDPESLEPDIWDQESATFLSARHPRVALRRWYKTHLADFKETVEFLPAAAEFVGCYARLSAVLQVAQLYDVGADWVRMEYDPRSRALSDAPVDQRIDGALDEVKAQLQQVQESEEHRLMAKVLRRMVDERSKFLRWSPDAGKLFLTGVEGGIVGRV